MSTLHNKARHFLCSRKPPPSFQSPLSLFSLYLTFDSVSTADVIRRPGARAREERLSEELANPDETTGATKADAQSSAAAAATQAATTFILKLDWVFLFREEVVVDSLRALGGGSVAFFNKNHTLNKNPPERLPPRAPVWRCIAQARLAVLLGSSLAV